MKYAFVWLLGCAAPWAWKFMDELPPGDATGSAFFVSLLAMSILVVSGLLLLVTIGNAIYEGWDFTEKKP